MLADALEQMGITSTGTVLSNKQGLLVESKRKQKISKGTTESYRCTYMMALAWQDKSHITMFVCQTRPENPALCPDECFKNILPNRYSLIIVLHLSHIHTIV